MCIFILNQFYEVFLQIFQFFLIFFVAFLPFLIFTTFFRVKFLQPTTFSFRSNHSGSELKLDQSTPSNSPKIVTQLPISNAKKIPPGIVREEQIRGEVKDFAFRAYMDAAGGPLVCFIAICTILLHTGTNAFSSYWLALWIKEGSGAGVSFYLT